MFLTKDKSLCETNQAIIVSKDRGGQTEHRAENPKRKFEVRQYQLDGDIFRQITCCDFLLVNDSTRKAYYIELKGSDIAQAIDQLTEGEKKCKAELHNYTSYYRIVANKARTHEIRNIKYRKFKEKHGKYFDMKTTRYVEVLD